MFNNQIRNIIPLHVDAQALEVFPIVIGFVHFNTHTFSIQFLFLACGQPIRWQGTFLAFTTVLLMKSPGLHFAAFFDILLENEALVSHEFLLCTQNSSSRCRSNINRGWLLLLSGGS
jgi:hypothetical protein